MIKDRLLPAIVELMEILQTQESKSITAAATLIATAVSQSRSVVLYDRGHLIGGELLGRAGGPVFMRRLDYALPDPALRTLQTGIRQTRLMSFAGREKDLATFAFEDSYTDFLVKTNDLGKGDVMIINSVSGRGHSATSVAKAAKTNGVSLIIITSSTAAARIAPEGGGKRLIDYADILIDNHVPFGDAMFELEGVEEKVCPASGFSAAYIGWAMVVESIELAVGMGVSPTILRSNNIPGGPEQNAAAFARYGELGY
jgi:uncharacterized phosphosugar-binding protein